jgi:hypothetical protein
VLLAPDTELYHTRHGTSPGAAIMQDVKSSRQPSTLAAVVQQHAGSSAWNTLHACAALTHLAQLQASVHSSAAVWHGRHTALQLSTELGAQVLRGIGSLRARQLSNCTWALARLAHSQVLPLGTLLLGSTTLPAPAPAKAADLLQALAARAGSRFSAFSPQEISSFAYGLALVGWCPKMLGAGWLTALLQRASECLGSMTPQGLSDMLWALAAWIPAVSSGVVGASHAALLLVLRTRLWEATTPQLLAAACAPTRCA